MADYSADDLALASLLQIVPGGYRLIDVTDSRFTGVRDLFGRLALRHIGPTPSLVGFCGPGQDPAAAAAAAAGWAAANLVPTAIQRRVDPGVVVVAVDPGDGTAPGMVAGLPVPTAIWTVRAGRLMAPGRPPGAPKPRLVAGALATLEKGGPPPSIGQIDVAERALLTGRSSRRSFTLGGGAGIGLLIGGYLLLRILPGVFAPRQPAPPARQEATCAAPDCVALGAADNGRQVELAPGALVVVVLPQGTEQASCFRDSDPAVLQLVQCTTTGGGSPEVAGTYRAAAPGTATLSRDQYAVTVTVR
ncbi:MAG: hypothetical protein M3010_12975 [Candidatus Dormibacteraeota bacterium]|nr:hypothetical protein [Candidatus Dormibacteraeota bacterium]